MDVAQKQAINLSVLKRHDNSITKIIESASHVVVYNFETKLQTWQKKGIEGTMFIFSRNNEPSTGFFVMNRLGLENLTVFITSDMEIEISGDFVIYKTSDDNVSGLWIYEAEDRERVGKLLQEKAKQEHIRSKILQSVSISSSKGQNNISSSQQQQQSLSTAPSSSSHGKNDILSLLQKAKVKVDQKQFPSPTPSSTNSAMMAAPSNSTMTNNLLYSLSALSLNNTPTPSTTYNKMNVPTSSIPTNVINENISLPPSTVANFPFSIPNTMTTSTTTTTLSTSNLPLPFLQPSSFPMGMNMATGPVNTNPIANMPTQSQSQPTSQPQNQFMSLPQGQSSIIYPPSSTALLTNSSVSQDMSTMPSFTNSNSTSQLLMTLQAQVQGQGQSSGLPASSSFLSPSQQAIQGLPQPSSLSPSSSQPQAMISPLPPMSAPTNSMNPVDVNSMNSTTMNMTNMTMSPGAPVPPPMGPIGPMGPMGQMVMATGAPMNSMNPIMNSIPNTLNGMMLPSGGTGNGMGTVQIHGMGMGMNLSALGLPTMNGGIPPGMPMGMPGIPGMNLNNMNTMTGMNMNMNMNMSGLPPPPPPPLSSQQPSQQSQQQLPPPPPQQSPQQIPTSFIPLPTTNSITSIIPQTSSVSTNPVYMNSMNRPPTMINQPIHQQPPPPSQQQQQPSVLDQFSVHPSQLSNLPTSLNASHLQASSSTLPSLPMTFHCLEDVWAWVTVMSSNSHAATTTTTTTTSNSHGHNKNIPLNKNSGKSKNGKINHSIPTPSTTTDKSNMDKNRLSRPEFQKQVIQLLKNDPNFLNALYEAYLLS